MQILLLDMDSVLLNPMGYYRALQETVRLVATTLGFAGRNLSQNEIEHFEAAGVTSEWESSAICACLMLREAWNAGIEIDLPGEPPLPTVEPHGVAWPDLKSFFQELADQDPSQRALVRAEELLVGSEVSPSRSARYRHLLRKARHIDGSVTHRLFQELALGSDVFEQTYHLAPVLHCPSYLFEYDESCLSAALLANLLTWLDGSDHAAVIFTNRPSSPPDGYFDTPEAELGRRAVGLDPVPILGGGGAGWLAVQHGLDIETYLKPSPVHALAALAMLATGDQSEALLAAHRQETGQHQPLYDALNGAQVFVLEDSVKGMRSAQLARDRLSDAGVAIELVLLGISGDGPKRERLLAHGVDVYNDISEALARVPGIVT